MEILSYRELESKDGLLPLLDHAFNWVFDLRQFENSIKIDPRLRGGPIGFVAVENQRVIGHVGVMDIATRNRYREIEYTGGIYGVATLPGFTRKGVSMTLMDRAHRYFQMKGYRFSFLVTNHALVAHSLYVKLGYSDLLGFPNAYKVVKSSGTKSTVKGIVRGLNFDRILSIYDKFTENKTGLVVRDIQYLKMLRKVEGLKAKQCLIGKNGYVIFRQDKSGIWIRELVALSTKGTDELLSVIENQSKGSVYDRMILDDTLLSVYRAREYMIHQRSHSVMMLKTLAPGASFEKTYGDSFYMTRLDGF